ncbi:MFS transporter [Streptomyces sp. SCA3-4]|uniref:MFS transporter n=1 Tax=Streptomyces sichuanensis TaxID=2871810 RepID=UPI001CE39FA8|nr:MFS transporter [Streptomyces sichuanensis]MCA6095553.1 MFS transporter [Streptomyces sichuanensis]
MRHIRLLRSRPVRVLWLSMTLSVLGDRLYGLAAMWVVYAATGSSSLMGLVAAVESLPYIVLGGSATVMARFSRWRRLAWIDAGRAAAAAGVPLLWSPDLPGFVAMLVLVLLLGALSAVFEPNLGALIPQLVEPDEVAQVSCLFDLTARVAAVIGQGCVGVLLQLVSEIQLFAIDGFTFVVSALALGWLGRRTTLGKGTPAAGRPRSPRAADPRHGGAQPDGVQGDARPGGARPRDAQGGARSGDARPGGAQGGPRPGRDQEGAGGRARGARGPDDWAATDGLQVVRARIVLRAHRRVGVAIAVHGVALFAAAVSTVGLPPLLVSRFGQGAAGYGLALAATAAGGLAGNLLTGHLPHRWPWLTTYCAAWTGAGLSLAGLGVADSMAAVIGLCVLSGLLFPVCAVTLRTHLSRFGPAARLRLLTVDQTAVRAAGTVGMLLLPFAVDAAPAEAFVGAGALLSALALLGWWVGRRAGEGPLVMTDAA